MAQMRTQISLIFDDENLFNNFIIPYKEQRALNGVILRCLKAYYYSDEAREKIELANNQDYGEDGIRDEETEKILQGIRESLLMQSFLADELEDTLSQGVQDVSDILNKTNETAAEFNMAKTTRSQFNSQILQIEAQKARLPMNGDSTSTNTVAPATNLSNDVMTSILLLIAQKLDIPEINAILKGSDISVQPVAQPEEPKIERQISQPVETVESKVEPVKSNVFAPQTNPVGDDFDIFESDAAKDMQDLLDSLM